MKILKHNWQWKLASLVIGFFLWSYVMAEVNPSQNLVLRDVVVDVQLESSGDKEYVISAVEPSSVTMNLVGKRAVLTNFLPTSVSATAVVSRENLKEGTLSVPIKYLLPDNVQLSGDSEVRTVSVTLEEVITKQVNVQPIQIGELPNDYILEGAAASPDYVQVKGPRSKVERVAHLAATVDLSNMTENQTTNVALEVVDADGKVVEGVTATTNTVNLAINIAKTKEVPLVINLTGTISDTVRIRRSQVYPTTVQIKGKKEFVDAIESLQTERVDLSQVTDNLDQQIGVIYPEGVTSVSPDFKTRLTLTVEKKTQKVVEIPYASIQVTPPEGLSYAFDNPAASVHVTASGFESDLESLTAGRITLQLDLSALSEGKQRVDLVVKGPEGITLAPNPSQIGVTITPQ